MTHSLARPRSLVLASLLAGLLVLSVLAVPVESASSYWVDGSDSYCAVKGNSTSQDIAWTDPYSGCTLQRARHRYQIYSGGPSYWTSWGTEYNRTTAFSPKSRELTYSEHIAFS